MSEASRNEQVRSRTSQALDVPQAVLKDAANVTHQSQALVNQSRTLSEELQQVREQGRALRESGRQRRAEWRGEPAMPVAGILAEASPAAALLDVYSLLEPLPGAVTIQFIRCGKGGCHCQTDGGHGPYFYRVWRDDQVRKEYVPATRLEEVKAQCALYLKFQGELKRLVREREAIWRRMTKQNKRLVHSLSDVKAA